MAFARTSEFVVDIEDIIQIGMLGLISAAQNYTPKMPPSPHMQA